MSNELSHYGTPGMRWGVKKEKPKRIQPIFSGTTSEKRKTINNKNQILKKRLAILRGEDPNTVKVEMPEEILEKQIRLTEKNLKVKPKEDNRNKLTPILSGAKLKRLPTASVKNGEAIVNDLLRRKRNR